MSTAGELAVCIFAVTFVWVMSSASMLRKTDSFTGQRTVESMRLHNYHAQSRLLRTGGWVFSSVMFLTNKNRTNLEILMAVAVCLSAATITWVRHTPQSKAEQYRIDRDSTV